MIYRVVDVGDYVVVEIVVIEGVEEIGNVDIFINNVGLYVVRFRNWVLINL